MTSVYDLETPVVMIDLDVLESNLRRMAQLAKRAGVKLRPHTKTHKSVWLAREQLRYGASGITVAKLGEAEVMAAAGIDDILVAYPIVGKAKLDRLARLLERADVTVSVDDPEVARPLSELGVRLGRPIPLYVDVNTGLNRCGKEPGEETADLVRRLADLPGIRVKGLMTHAGHAYSRKSPDEVFPVARDEADALVRTKQILEQRDGIQIGEISVGSTPTSKFVGELAGVTEMRPGAYIFGDAVQWDMGIIDESQCAMSVLATVVSCPRPGTAIVDAGSKTLSSDLNPHRPGYGRIRGLDGAVIERLSEEHGIVRLPEGVSLKIGQTVEIIPNHCCVVTNLHDRLAGVRNGQLEMHIEVDARGKVR